MIVGGQTMVKFRFQGLKIWQLTIEVAYGLFDIYAEYSVPYALCE